MREMTASSSDEWQRRFMALGTRLAMHRPLWQERAFHHHQLSWQAHHPALSRALDALDLATAEELQADPQQARRWLQCWLPWVDELEELCALPVMQRPAQTLSERQARGTPGRKWQQINAFVGSLKDRGGSVLEWCAGKGHLSRAVSACWAHRPVQGLELQPELVAAGNQLARRDGLPVQLHVCNVLDGHVGQFLQAASQVLALHACGDLHGALLRQSVAFKVAAVAWSPCCYHRTDGAMYRPLSAFGQRHDLALSQDVLRTIVQETVTAPARERDRRRRLQQWRLGFDRLQRDLRGVDEYLPVATLPGELANGSFREFCLFVAEKKQLQLPLAVNWDYYQAAGEQRFRQVTAQDLVRMLFRRPLEVWLVLDQLLFMQEHGYRTRLVEFCARALTPRNLLLQAWV